MSGGGTSLLSEFILTDEQLRAIGCLVLEASHLESYIDLVIERACKDADAVPLLMKGKMFDGKVDLLQGLLEPKIKGKKRRLEFHNLCSDIKSDNQKRNTVVHGDWGAARRLNTDELMAQRASGTTYAMRKVSPVQVKASDVMALAIRFANYQLAVLAAYAELELSRLRASRRKYSSRSARQSKIGLGSRSPKKKEP